MSPIEEITTSIRAIFLVTFARRSLKASDVLKIYPAMNTDFFRIFDDEGKLLAIVEKEPHAMSFKPYLVIPEDDQK